MKKGVVGWQSTTNLKWANRYSGGVVAAMPAIDEDTLNALPMSFCTTESMAARLLPRHGQTLPWPREGRPLRNHRRNGRTNETREPCASKNEGCQEPALRSGRQGPLSFRPPPKARNATHPPERQQSAVGGGTECDRSEALRSMHLRRTASALINRRQNPTSKQRSFRARL